ncbi:NAD(P)-dependent glycerol-3-phosphate dehydrogenase [Sphingomonas lutea]|uniref:Glycerol-3-phosphate dehydrogenase [NAD(P)+] n=1 Tax=Sphingomonas lutea TaxID=1045317 RepID=A0A7G9SIF6_9SPHN|nr:NAD(P)H-dependent glycerol-3-phosphate dehydrogenase [Sphingomonas lutea]QNN67631.1 NAD(P)-dependent glycerol-3-phosphate dehydrogenase [Sphingomonas lutea]
MNINRIAVVGGGAWGTALAQVAAKGGRETLLWALEEEVVGSINDRRENGVYLPGLPLDPAIRATGDLGDLADCDAWLMVTPAQHMRSVLDQAPRGSIPLVLCSKGIEGRSGKLLHDVAREVRLDSPIAVLSGPTFAHEVAAGLPTAVTLACGDRPLGQALRERINRVNFRTYCTDDVAGAEVGGAVKNVLAIACGIVEGKRLGQNARAALIARGFAEMTRFGLALGGRRETLAGLSGLGDLVLTCSSVSSRNFSLGKAIGEGQDVAALMTDRRTVAEGAHTAPVLHRLAVERGIDMPIVAAVNDLLEGRVGIDELLETMLSRPPGDEED